MGADATIGFMAGSRRGMSRRQVLIAGMAVARLAGQPRRDAASPADWRQYADPSTEFPVYRLTDPAYTSLLPPWYNRAIPRRNTSLVFACDRSGAPQAHRMDLRTGETAQLTAATAFDPATLAPTADGRAIAFFDGPELHWLPTSAARGRTLYTVAEKWERGAGLSVTGDGAAALFVERQGERSRMRTVASIKPAARTIVEAPFAMEHPIARPARDQVLYRQSGQALWLVDGTGAQNRKLKLAEGAIGPADWSADGKTVLYLRVPPDPGQLIEIREHTPDSNTDKLVAKTSQFASFGFNRDTSVFIGASRNLGSPAVLLLLRVTRREFTLCEHKAANARSVAPFFAPDAQRIYFQSDRHGKPALYCVHVEKLVEKIEAES
jgi:oligogalacturonide lyase